MEEWTKYVLDNVENDKVLHYCASNLSKDILAAHKALAEEKNQLATELVCDMANHIELLQALDEKANGKKNNVNIA